MVSFFVVRFLNVNRILFEYFLYFFIPPDPLRAVLLRLVYCLYMLVIGMGTSTRRVQRYFVIPLVTLSCSSVSIAI